MQRRHLRGVELGLVAVVMAVIAVWLSLPRPVEPGEVLPLPEVNREREQAERVADHERAERARQSALPYEVRAVGELVRRYGLYESRGDDNGADRARQDAFEARRRAQARFGPEPLRALRALQTELFAARLEKLGRLVSDDRELSELAGNLPAHARRAGWAEPDGALRLSKQELLTFYRVRWTRLVGAISDDALGPSLAEFRAYYRALLEHPESPDPRERDERRLAYADALGRRDPGFFAAFTRGVLLYRLGDTGAAAQAFTEHLREHPDGPWSLRAKNHLLYLLTDVDGSVD
jgi:hypothetical protein